MGYETEFTLSVSGPQEEIDKLDLKVYREELDWRLRALLRREGSQELLAKWYSWEKDMRELSSQFPTIRFDLDGEGEEHGDQWSATFLRGKAHIRRCEMIPPADFDPEKLT